MRPNDDEAGADAVVGRDYLRPEVKMEPLVCRWPAWPHLLAPATLAMNAAFRHLPNLKSFVANPTVHVAASKDPTMLGGPFVCLSQGDVPAVREALKVIPEQCAPLLAFARNFKELDGRLRASAKGASLDEFCDTMPEPLAGLLELVYDLNSHPRIKVIEELLYDQMAVMSDIYEICLHRTAETDRNFFMSTPMLDASDRIFVRMPFKDPRIDELAAMRIAPGCAEALASRLGVAAGQRDLFLSFFTSEPPQRRAPVHHDEDVRVRYLGHACVLLQTAQVAVLIDPVTAWERDEAHATLTFADLPDFIDYVVLSHSHQDHMVMEMLLQLRKRVGRFVVPGNDRGNLADPAMNLMLRHTGFDNVEVATTFESIPLPGGEILLLPFIGEHAGLDIASKHSIVVRLKGRTFCFLIDSNGVESALYARLGARIGKIDALFIGMECHGAPLTWLYGPLLTGTISRRDDDSRRLSGSDCRRAWGVVQQLQCSRVFVYAMGQEPWLKHLMGLAYKPDSVQLLESGKFVERCRESGIPAERLFGCRELRL
jgi:L-ascorbate metabolism protein UlaG (beta-lactamase superfamily)